MTPLTRGNLPRPPATSRRLAGPAFMAGRPRAFSLVEVLVVIGMLGALVGMLLPAIQSTRESARRARCMEHLRQVALGVCLHESARRAFPAGCDMVPRGPALPEGTQHAWSSLILPYIDERGLAARIDYAKMRPSTGQTRTHLPTTPTRPAAGRGSIASRRGRHSSTHAAATLLATIPAVPTGPSPTAAPIFSTTRWIQWCSRRSAPGPAVRPMLHRRPGDDRPAHQWRWAAARCGRPCEGSQWSTPAAAHRTGVPSGSVSNERVTHASQT